MMAILIALVVIALVLLMLMLLAVKSDEKNRQQCEQKMQRKVTAIKDKGDILAAELEKIPADCPQDERLEILYLAATQPGIRFDLAAEYETVAVGYPTAKMDFVQIDDASQLPQISLADTVLDDDSFYYKFVNRDLLRQEYFDVTEKRKRMYVLQDISPSMKEKMQLKDGETLARDTFARGVIASLLIDAVNGHAEYFLRPFSDSTSSMESVLSPDTAAKLLSKVVRESKFGNGTNIGRAVSTAVRDIKKMQSQEFLTNHILLITDGEDQAGLTRKYLEDCLSNDTKLHVVLIGTTYGPEHPLAPYVVARY
jgi:hypothetical protein